MLKTIQDALPTELDTSDLQVTHENVADDNYYDFSVDNVESDNNNNGNNLFASTNSEILF